MADELTFRDEAAAEYDRAFAHVTAYFMPFLLHSAHVAPGMRVLDIATGTGLSAEAALAAVGPNGHVTAADVSPAMAGKARERLGKVPNVSVSVEDGQALSFSGESFDAVLCNLGLMFFPDPMRGLMEFRRVLSSGGRGGCSTGQALVGLSEDIRRAIREEARRDLCDTGGPGDVELPDRRGPEIAAFRPQGVGARTVRRGDRPHRGARPEDQRGCRARFRAGARRGRGSRPGTGRRQRRGSAVARYPDDGQGAVQYRRLGDDLGISEMPRLASDHRRADDRAAEGSRCGDHRQNQRADQSRRLAELQ